MRRMRAGAALITAAVVLLGSGCSSGSDSKSGDQVTIQYWTNDTTNPVEQKIVDDYMATHPSVKVVLTRYNTNQYLQAMKIGATNRTLPDVFFEGLGATLAHQYIDAGVVLNLDSYAQKNGWDSQFSKLSVDVLKYHDKWWEIPENILGMGIFYNKKVFADNGLQPPATFADLQRICATLQAKGITPISIGGQGSWMTMRFVNALMEHYAGPQTHDQIEARQQSWNSPPVIQAFTTLRDWTQKKYFTPGFLSIDPSTDTTSLFQEQAAMVFEGPWFDAGALAKGQKIEDYGFFPFPEDQTPNRLSTFAQGVMVAANSKHKDAAVDFATYRTSREVCTKHGSEMNGPIARLDCPDQSSLPNLTAIKKIINEQGAGYLPTDQQLPQQLVNTFFQHQDAVVAGTETPEQGAKAIQDAIQNTPGN